MVMSLTACGNSELDAEIQRLQEQLERLEGNGERSVSGSRTDTPSSTVWETIPLDRNATPEEVTERYLNATLVDFDLNTVRKYSAIDIDVLYTKFIQHAEDKYSVSQADIYEYIMDELGTTDFNKIYAIAKDEVNEFFIEMYGADYKTTISIFEERELTATEINEVLDKLWKSNIYYPELADMGVSTRILQINGIIPLEKITAISYVQGRMTITGSIRNDSNAFNIMCVKIDGAWQVLNESSIVVLMLIAEATHAINESRKVEIPKLYGMNIDEAIRTYDWLNFEVIEKYSDYPVGTIFNQNDSPYGGILPDDVVTIYVSLGQRPPSPPSQTNDWGEEATVPEPPVAVTWDSSPQPPTYEIWW
jgi:hypothetical protein